MLAIGNCGVGTYVGAVPTVWVPILKVWVVKASVVWFPIVICFSLYCGAGLVGAAGAAGAAAFGFLAPTAGAGISEAGLTASSSAALAGVFFFGYSLAASLAGAASFLAGAASFFAGAASLAGAASFLAGAASLAGAAAFLSSLT